MKRDARLLADALRDPASTAALDADGWTALLTMARAELLLGSLAYRLDGQKVPEAVAAILAEAKVNADHQRRSALWEADCAQRALSGNNSKIVLMKGTAYVAADLNAGQGRSIGDLDIMVAEADLREVETALFAAGWEWVKEDDYDDAYYRQHMHELPPLIHKERDRMIDVHHTILPKTARPTPDAAGMLDDAVRLDGGLHIFAPADMVIHSAAHMFADGDLAGGLRNLWDMHCLFSEFAEADAAFWPKLKARATHHQLLPAVERAGRLAAELYGTELPSSWKRGHWQDQYYLRRILARDGWGRRTRKFTRLSFYIRSHWLRMPPLTLARHLWVKWRKGSVAG